MSFFINFTHTESNSSATQVTCGELSLVLPRLGAGEDINTGIGIESENVISLALRQIGLLYDGEVGKLEGLDIVNAGAVDVIYSGLMEDINKGIVYDMYLDPELDIPIVYTVSNDTSNASSDNQSNSTEYDQQCKAVVVTGGKPLAYVRYGEPINLIDHGTGDGVEIISYADFNYGGCGGSLYNYYGAIAYTDPRFNITSASDISHALELKSFETLTGLIYMLSKPDDVEVTFTDSTLFPVKAVLSSLEEGSNEDKMNLAFAVEVDYDRMFNLCDGCIQVDMTEGTLVYTASEPILGLDSALLYGSRLEALISVDNFKGSESDGICGENSNYNGDNVASSTEECSNVLSSTSVYNLSIGTDVMYSIEGDTDTYSIKVGIPVFSASWLSWWGDKLVPREWHTLPTSLSTVRLPADVYLLITRQKPSITFIKTTNYAIGVGHGNDEYDDKVQAVASVISLCVVPIITVDPPAPIAYSVNDEVTVVDVEECRQDSDLTTVQNFDQTPCGQMEAALDGCNVTRLTVGSVLDNEGIAEAAANLGNMVVDNSKIGAYSVDPFSVSPSSLGQSFKGGVINRISWNFQYGSSYRASVSCGPILVANAGNVGEVKALSTDPSVTRQATVMEDKGDGVNFKIYIPNLGFCDAVAVVPVEINVGDLVSVTIYNNVAESI